jgi:transcriptional regulator with PAS, ATPase and Fis domain
MVSEPMDSNSGTGSMKDVCIELEAVLDAIPEPIVIVDSDARVIIFNKEYQRFLKIPKQEAIGKPVTEIIDNTGLHITCRTQREEIDIIQNIHGRDAIVQRIPLYIQGEFAGAIGKVNFRNVEEIKSLLKKISALENKVEKYEQNMHYRAEYTFEDIIGDSDEIIQIKVLAQKMAKTNSTLLVLGETGVGKELLVHAIHNTSERRKKPFISVNCAAIPPDLLESDLFGYEEGAFTGARKKGKPGKFHLADGGTLFLDEIGDMSLRMQAKLLRVLQDKEIEKVGGVTASKVDVRVITATNQDLKVLVENGEFRADLYYRINTLSCTIPPLRERKGDIPLIVHYTLDRLNRLENHHKSITPEAVELLTRYHWPGNVRELVNIMERMVFLSDNPIIESSHVERAVQGLQPGPRPAVESGVFLENAVAKAEKDAIMHALTVSKGNRVRAAELLGIHRTTLYQKMHRYNIR